MKFPDFNGSGMIAPAKKANGYVMKLSNFISLVMATCGEAGDLDIDDYVNGVGLGVGQWVCDVDLDTGIAYTYVLDTRKLPNKENVP